MTSQLALILVITSSSGPGGSTLAGSSTRRISSYFRSRVSVGISWGIGGSYATTTGKADGCRAPRSSAIVAPPLFPNTAVVPQVRGKQPLA